MDCTQMRQRQFRIKSKSENSELSRAKKVATRQEQHPIVNFAFLHFKILAMRLLFGLLYPLRILNARRLMWISCKISSLSKFLFRPFPLIGLDKVDNCWRSPSGPALASSHLTLIIDSEERPVRWWISPLNLRLGTCFYETCILPMFKCLYLWL